MNAPLFPAGADADARAALAAAVAAKDGGAIDSAIDAVIQAEVLPRLMRETEMLQSALIDHRAALGYLLKNRDAGTGSNVDAAAHVLGDANLAATIGDPASIDWEGVPDAAPWREFLERLRTDPCALAPVCPGSVLCAGLFPPGRAEQ